MKTLIKQIAALALLLLLICVLHRVATGNAYTAYISPEADAWMAPETLRVGEIRPDGDHGRVTVVPLTRDDASIRIYDGQRWLDRRDLRISPLMTVYDASTGGFTGDTTVLISTTLFYLIVSVLMMRYYLRVRVPEFYGYASIYTAGFSLFALMTGATMGYVTLRHLIHPAAFSMLDAYDVISRSGYRFMIFTAPFVLAFAVAMAVSNIELMRHDRKRLKNALGILAGLLLLGGEAVAIAVNRADWPGHRQDLQQVIMFVFPTVFVYFECMLFGAILCGLRAARHAPAFGADCLIILGCWFRRDGTLPPLLKGRADKAVEFWRAQKAATGREALLIPSGGQGKDEPMPEGRAMGEYLKSQGISETFIRTEERSLNTYQNMAYSKEIIERERPGGRTVFVTTNYHVFRSGLWANRAGLPCEGLGSPTRWWYWPNAFMREWIGLLVNCWRQELLMLLLMLAYFSLLAALL